MLDGKGDSVMPSELTSTSKALAGNFRGGEDQLGDSAAEILCSPLYRSSTGGMRLSFPSYQSTLG